jgi:ubiquinol-cytochrome c reductase cytochrome c subunit
MMPSLHPGTFSIALVSAAMLSIAGVAASRPAALPGLAAPQAAPAAAPKGDPVRGRSLHTKYGCWQCHGYEGQGGVGPRLAPSPLPFDVFEKIVRHPPSQMPPYTAKVVTEQDLRDIHTFLGSVPAPPDPAGIPLLKELLAAGK